MHRQHVKAKNKLKKNAKNLLISHLELRHPVLESLRIFCLKDQFLPEPKIHPTSFDLACRGTDPKDEAIFRSLLGPGCEALHVLNPAKT